MALRMAPQHEAGRLYDAYGASLYRYALMILARPEAAEDAVQQVFTALLAAPARDIENEEAYLRRAVRNACYSTLRHEQVRRGPPLEDALLEQAADGPAVSEEQRLTLSRAIAALLPEQREVVHLHVFEGRTFKEVADLTGDPPNTVASRYRYALDHLKAALGKRTQGD